MLTTKVFVQFPTEGLLLRSADLGGERISHSGGPVHAKLLRELHLPAEGGR